MDPENNLFWKELSSENDFFVSEAESWRLVLVSQPFQHSVRGPERLQNRAWEDIRLFTRLRALATNTALPRYWVDSTKAIYGIKILPSFSILLLFAVTDA